MQSHCSAHLFFCSVTFPLPLPSWFRKLPNQFASSSGVLLGLPGNTGCMMSGWETDIKIFDNISLKLLILPRREEYWTGKFRVFFSSINNDIHRSLKQDKEQNIFSIHYLITEFGTEWKGALETYYFWAKVVDWCFGTVIKKKSLDSFELFPNLVMIIYLRQSSSDFDMMFIVWLISRKTLADVIIIDKTETKRKST